ncbi:uncharacterized protein LOC114878497 isoform X1 [Osmia bicornis bicornis]|uniref:uncharacterized protein LOC114878497 isoform X1 n=2 Tax=Osmia bicornis bicornis TaxID=1437191 RepID=UPI001EAE9A75|nr:uncharacterized protein LOC114878497 isoform X1 [Osmia bicornis bicornis]
MEKFGHNDQEFFKSLVPKARPSIRNTSINSENLLLKKNMYKSRHHYSNLSDDSDDDTQSGDDDDSDDQNHDNNRYSGESLNNSSQNVLDSFRSANNYSYTSKVYERNFHSPNTSHPLNTTSNYSPKPIHYQSKQKSGTQYPNIFLCSVACIVVLSILFIIQAVPCKNVDQETLKPKVETKATQLIKVDKMLDKSMQIIQTKFNNQKSSIWNDISAAIYDVILYPKKPSIITLFGKEVNTLNCLAQLLGQLSGAILGCNNYLILAPKDFPNDVGQVIYNLKAKILEKPAVIIQDLLNVNTEAIKAFHNFCDRENPLVEHVIYIITMVVDDYTLSQKELEFVEKKLIRRLSGKIEKDILDPLITRLTDGIIVPILPESSTSFNYTDCSFPEEQINKLKAVIS